MRSQVGVMYLPRSSVLLLEYRLQKAYRLQAVLWHVLLKGVCLVNVVTIFCLARQKLGMRFPRLASGAHCLAAAREMILYSQSCGMPAELCSNSAQHSLRHRFLVRCGLISV
jgi:hypothetical protein